MHMSNPADTEALLCAAYERQIAHYQHALRAADELLAAIAAGDSIDGPAGRLAAALDQTAAIDSSLQLLKQAWQGMGHTPGPRLQAILGDAARTVEHLIERVRRAETETEARRTLLLPELELQARSRRMQQVYGSARRT
jgi:hypothetical protein